MIERDDRFHIKKPVSRNYKVGVFISDQHGKHDYNIKDPESFMNLIDQNRYDAVFHRYNSIEGTKYPSDIHHFIRAPFKWIPWSVDTMMFYKRPAATVDVTFTGATYRDVYPLREDIHQNLREVAAGYSVVSEHRPPYRTSIKELLSKGYFVGEKYAQLLGQSRIFIFDCSKYRYPIQKFFEASASGCLVMSTRPTNAVNLGFIDGVTYVEIDKDNWKEKLLYYLKHQKEAEKIAEKGMKMTRFYHSHQTRAAQFVEVLKGKSIRP